MWTYPTNLQEDLTKVKILQKVWGGGYFYLKHPVHVDVYVPEYR